MGSAELGKRPLADRAEQAVGGAIEQAVMGEAGLERADEGGVTYKVGVSPCAKAARGLAFRRRYGGRSQGGVGVRR